VSCAQTADFCDGNDATPATWNSASLTRGMHITKRHRRSCWSTEKAVTCTSEGDRTSLRTPAKIKSANNSLPRKTRYVSRRIRRSYLNDNKANKVSKSEGTKNVEYAYHFWKYANAVYPKLLKSSLVDSCRNYNLPKLTRFLRQSIYASVVFARWQHPAMRIIFRSQMSTIQPGRWWRALHCSVL